MEFSEGWGSVIAELGFGISAPRVERAVRGCDSEIADSGFGIRISGFEFRAQRRKNALLRV